MKALGGHLNNLSIEGPRKRGKFQQEAADRAKEADDAKRAADEQISLLKADRERQERRLQELVDELRRRGIPQAQ